MARMKFTMRKPRRKRPQFKTHKHYIKICKRVRTHGSEGKAYIRKLHAAQGRKGHVKIPGYRHAFFMSAAHRKEARAGKKHHRNILARLNRQHKAAKRMHRRLSYGKGG